VRATFEKRGTHGLAKELDPPPKGWEPVFDELVTECHLEMKMGAGFEVVREFRRTLEV
jgi:hypothetical protein